MWIVVVLDELKTELKELNITATEMEEQSMKSSTFNKANDIVKEINKLNDELACLRRNCVSAFIMRYRWKLKERSLTGSDRQFKLTDEDRNALIALRESKIKCLEEELKNL